MDSPGCGLTSNVKYHVVLHTYAHKHTDIS